MDHRCDGCEFADIVEYPIGAHATGVSALCQHPEFNPVERHTITYTIYDYENTKYPRSWEAEGRRDIDGYPWSKEKPAICLLTDQAPIHTDNSINSPQVLSGEVQRGI